VTHYAVSATERSVRTGCEKWLRRGADYTTAALVTDCPGCIDSEGWANREGRLGIGDPDAQVHDEIAMHPPEAGAGTRFKRRQQKQQPKGEA